MPSSLSVRNNDMIRFAGDIKLARSIWTAFHKRFAIKLKEHLLIADRETAWEDETTCAIIHGVERAWIYRFLSEQGVEDPKKYFPQRRDRLGDLDLLQKEYPQFKDWIPIPEITEKEIRIAAEEDLEYFLLSTSSDSYRRQREESFPDEFPRETGVGFSILSNEAFGPAALRVSAHFASTFGLTLTTYYIFCKYIFDGKIPDTVEAFNKGLREQDIVRFRTIYRDLSRKFSLMDRELEALRQDPVLKEYFYL